MIFDNSETDLFYQFYEDAPFDFLINAKLDTAMARKKCEDLLRKIACILDTLKEVEKEEKKWNVN